MLPTVKNDWFPATISNFFNDDWNNLFDWSNRLVSNATGTLPATNIKETEDSFVVEMAAPGMTKEDFQIELLNNTLTIKSELKNEHEAKEGDNYTRREFSYTSFQRSFNLNHRLVDDTKIEAKYENGILRLVLPKREEVKAKPVRLIEIS